MSTKRLSIEIKNDLKELDYLCQKLEDYGKSIGISKKSFYHIILAVDEVCTNIISYGYKDDVEHIIRLDISQENGLLIINIEDDGIPFNPTVTKTPDLSCPIEERDVGGLGCYLMNNLMDDINYERTDNKNILTFKKKLGEC